MKVGRVERATSNDLLVRFVSCITVVPVMNGHPRDQAKVSVHCRWPLIRGTAGQAGTPNIIHLSSYVLLSPPAVFILNTCIVIMMYATVSKTKIKAT